MFWFVLGGQKTNQLENELIVKEKAFNASKGLSEAMAVDVLRRK